MHARPSTGREFSPTRRFPSEKDFVLKQAPALASRFISNCKGRRAYSFALLLFLKRAKMFAFFYRVYVFRAPTPILSSEREQLIKISQARGGANAETCSIYRRDACVTDNRKRIALQSFRFRRKRSAKERMFYGATKRHTLLGRFSCASLISIARASRSFRNFFFFFFFASGTPEHSQSEIC